MSSSRTDSQSPKQNPTPTKDDEQNTVVKSKPTLVGTYEHTNKVTKETEMRELFAGTQGGFFTIVNGRKTYMDATQDNAGKWTVHGKKRKRQSETREEIYEQARKRAKHDLKKEMHRNAANKEEEKAIILLLTGKNLQLKQIPTYTNGNTRSIDFGDTSGPIPSVYTQVPTKNMTKSESDSFDDSSVNEF